jgi:monovalent cation:H+ antiporter, CPA1 family
MRIDPKLVQALSPASDHVILGPLRCSGLIGASSQARRCMFDLVAALIVLTAALSYVNFRFLKLPDAIGVMVLAMAISLCGLVAGSFYPPVRTFAETFIARLDFGEAVLNGMLAFLLFAGALHVNLRELAGSALAIGVLAVVGTVLSTVMIGVLTWHLLAAIDVEMSLAHCLVFGALISPTDPIAVLGIVRRAGIAKSIETKIVGESLLNDGIAVVLFLILIDVTSGHTRLEARQLVALFGREVVGGVGLGLWTGFAAYRLCKSIDHYQVEILISLALAMGTFSLANHMHTSGPLAVVSAGLLLGNRGRTLAMSPTTVVRLDTFWETIDGILNSLLFVLIAIELLVLEFRWQYLAAGVMAVPVVLLARLISIAAPFAVFERWQQIERGAILILTWGGLRGGLSVAMALSISNRDSSIAVTERDAIFVMTWIVAAFSIVVQGLTIGRVARRWAG